MNFTDEQIEEAARRVAIEWRCVDISEKAKRELYGYCRTVANGGSSALSDRARSDIESALRQAVERKPHSGGKFAQYVTLWYR